MPAKKMQKKGSQARRAPIRVPPAISSSEDEGWPSLQDLVANTEALKRAKAGKQKYAERGASVAATPPGSMRSATCKLERDVEMKSSVKDDPRGLEKIKRMQIDKNFDN
ncbi:UNVERIFIED_CONTAM: hypothetical protein K2H54_045292 [Gekko kuhli]